MKTSTPHHSGRQNHLRPTPVPLQYHRAVDLSCPGCFRRMHLEPPELVVGRLVGCFHCGEESWLDRDDGAEGPGPWMLLPEWPEV